VSEHHQHITVIQQGLDMQAVVKLLVKRLLHTSLHLRSLAKQFDESFENEAYESYMANKQICETLTEFKWNEEESES
jgi:hypothetical protein